ncbi:MAG: hypothetical protein LBI03_05950 [Clostridiales bacterium]|jgi:hypothetical protein|nr:hypothetical protein [Clostridiales bacterium]
MKLYDTQIVKKVIKNEGKNIKSIYLGMKEDFAPTAAEVFRNGKTLISLDEKTVDVAGINGSIWATPVMEIEYTDGRKEVEPCFYDDGETAPDDEIQSARNFAQATYSFFSFFG